MKQQTCVPGVGVAVSVKGQRAIACIGTLALEGDIPFTVEARFPVSCLTKLLISLATLELASTGRLEMRVPISRYLPELEGVLPGDDLFVWHLLSHTSGYKGPDMLNDEVKAFTWDTFVEFLRGTRQLFSPGVVFNYEHTESVVLAAIISRITGTSCSEFLRTQILAPLDLSPGTTALDRQQPEIFPHAHRPDSTPGRFLELPLPEGSVQSQFWEQSFADITLSLRDLLTLAEALMPPIEDGVRPGAFSEATQQLLRKQVFRFPAMISTSRRPIAPVSYGFGTAQMPDGSYYCSASPPGQSVCLRYDPDTCTAIAITMNAPLGYLRDVISATICQSVTGRNATSPRDCRSFYTLDDVVGVYEGGGQNEVRISRKGDRAAVELRLDVTMGIHDLTTELAIAADGRAEIFSSIPHLSLGFFGLGGAQAGLVIGFNSYKKIQ